jgi:hypothetical protein
VTAEFERTNFIREECLTKVSGFVTEMVREIRVRQGIQETIRLTLLG